MFNYHNAFFPQPYLTQSKFMLEVPYSFENYFHYAIQKKVTVFSPSKSMLCVSFVHMK